MAFSKLGSEIFRDFKVALNSGSGHHNPARHDIRAWFAEVEELLPAYPLPAPIAGRLIAWNATADGFENVDVDSASPVSLFGTRTFNSIAYGLAGTPDGAYFFVLNKDSNELLSLYINDNGTAVSQGRGIVDNESFVTFDTSADGEFIHALADARNRLISGITQKGDAVFPFFSVEADEQNEDISFVDGRGRVISLSDILESVAGIGSYIAESLDDTYLIAVVDERNRFIIGVTHEGELDLGFVSIGADTYRDDVSISDPAGYAYSIRDMFDGIAALQRNSTAYTAFSDAEIVAQDGQAIALSNAVMHNGTTNLEPFVEGYRHVVQYGQSLSVGALGHPLRSSTMLYDALMIGNSIRTAAASNASFIPYGGVATLNAMAVTVEGPGSTNDILTDAEVLALDRDDTARGETSSAGFVDFGKFLSNQHNNVDNDASRRFVVTSTGRGGRNIAELSKGAAADPNFYLSTVDAAVKIKAAADNVPVASGVGVYIWEQGPADAAEGTSKATYEAGVLQLRDDLHADIQVGVYGRTKHAPWLFTQTGGKWTYDSTALAVQMAQLKMSLEQPDMFCTAPDYFVTSKSDGHLDANGYRWLGMFHAKVWYRVAVLKQGWKPLHIIKAISRSTQILLAYHVPAPPLQFRDAYNVFTAEMYANKGFSVVDDSGENTITSVDIVGDAAIMLILSRNTEGTAVVTYGGQNTFGGRGNVADSDNTEAVRNYEYFPAAGDDAAVNISALIDKPYPLNNFAVIQNINVTQG